MRFEVYAVYRVYGFGYGGARISRADLWDSHQDDGNGIDHDHENDDAERTDSDN